MLLQFDFSEYAEKEITFEGKNIIQTAKQVGSRYGKFVILEINSKLMFTNDLEFYQSENGVWLTDFVDPKYFKEL